MFFETRVVEEELERVERMVSEGEAEYLHLAGFRLNLMRLSKLVHGDSMSVVLNHSFGVPFAASLARILNYFGLTCVQPSVKDQFLIITSAKRTSQAT